VCLFSCDRAGFRREREEGLEAAGELSEVRRRPLVSGGDDRSAESAGAVAHLLLRAIEPTRGDPSQKARHRIGKHAVSGSCLGNRKLCRVDRPRLDGHDRDAGAQRLLPRHIFSCRQDQAAGRSCGTLASVDVHSAPAGMVALTTDDSLSIAMLLTDIVDGSRRREVVDHQEYVLRNEEEIPGGVGCR
jgi:hypothetical protein